MWSSSQCGHDLEYMLLCHHCDSCGTEKPQLFVNNQPESCFEMCGRRRRTSFRQHGWTVTCKRKGLETGATTGPRNNDNNQPRIGSWRNSKSNCKNSKSLEPSTERNQPIHDRGILLVVVLSVSRLPPTKTTTNKPTRISGNYKSNRNSNYKTSRESSSSAASSPFQSVHGKSDCRCVVSRPQTWQVLTLDIVV